MVQGTITMSLKDVSKATEQAPVKSKLLDVGGYKWQLICTPDRLVIVCNENCNEKLWLCKAKCIVEMKKGKADWKQIADSSFHLYWFNSFDITFRRFEENELEVQNIIKVVIEVEWGASQSNLPPLDGTLKMISNGHHDLIPVNKFVLAGHSKYFRNLFFGGKLERNSFFGKLAAVIKRKDANGNPIFDIREDPDFEYGKFSFMIHALLCMGTTLDQLSTVQWTEDKKSKIALLKMADKYQLQMFVDFAEKALIKLGPGTMELLALADKFTLAGLKDHCLTSITSIEYCKQIVENSEIRAGLGKVTSAQLDAKLKECANKGWKLG